MASTFLEQGNIQKYDSPSEQFSKGIEEDTITVETRIFGLKYQMERSILKHRRKIN